MIPPRGGDAERSAALHRHWKNPERIARVKRILRAALLRDCAAKEAAVAAGISAGKASKWARVLGFRMMYVTDAERREILKTRAVIASTASG